MLQLSIKVEGVPQVRTKLRRLGSSLYDLRVSMGQIGAEAARYYSNQAFNSQGGVFGASWTPLKRNTILRKAKTYPGRPPLVATGRMRNSFTYTANSRQVLIGNKADHFKFHQSTAPRSKMPRRQMMGVNEPVRRMVRDIISRDIKNKIRMA